MGLWSSPKSESQRDALLLRQVKFVARHRMSVFGAMFSDYTGSAMLLATDKAGQPIRQSVSQAGRQA